MKTYTTKQGDMWDAIAEKAMGSESLVGDLMRANRAYVHLYTLPAGVVLNIPEVKPAAIAEMPPWKRTEA